MPNHLESNCKTPSLSKSALYYWQLPYLRMIINPIFNIHGIAQYVAVLCWDILCVCTISRLLTTKTKRLGCLASIPVSDSEVPKSSQTMSGRKQGMGGKGYKH